MIVLLTAKSKYGEKVILNNGERYKFMNIVEKRHDGNFLIRIESNSTFRRFLVNLESDKDFIVKVSKN